MEVEGVVRRKDQSQQSRDIIPLTLQSIREPLDPRTEIRKYDRVAEFEGPQFQFYNFFFKSAL
jgi:hypothetical protein